MPKNLYQRNEIWYGRFAEGGTIRRVCLRTSDLRQAKIRLKALKTKVDDARFGVKNPKIWQEAVVSYTLGVLQAGGVRSSTADRYLVSLRQIDPHFKGVPLHDIDQERISHFIAARQAGGTANATIRRDLTTISRVLSFAAAQGMTTTNAALSYDRRLVRERSAALTIPTDADIADAIALAPPLWGDLFRFLRGTGLRLGEALRARWDHIQDGNLTVHITKNGFPRTIRLPEGILKGVAGKGRIFAGLPDDSGVVSSRYVTVRKTAKTMPRFRLHDLRHAYAIAEIRSGRDIYDLSHHLGHSSVKVTERYLGYAPGRRSVARDTHGDTR